jgi:FkbM family methyltransferase
VTYNSLVRSLPADFQIVLADIGSAGGLHKRWKPIRDHVTAILFDPLDESTGSGRDRYFPVAIADAKGEATLHVTKRISMTSTLLPNVRLLSRFWDKPDHTSIVATQQIPTDTLDNIMAANRIKLDAIKIDVQGGEHAILRGAANCLSNDLFFVEAESSFLERYSGLRIFQDVVALMADHEFDLIDVSRIKRYRYANNFGIVNPGLGLGDRAGRLAFCDAIFMLRDETLLARIRSGDDANLALKAIMVLLTYGKADIAAWLFDAASDRVPPAVCDQLARYFRNLGGRHFGRKGLHKALDYLARKV